MEWEEENLQLLIDKIQELWYRAEASHKPEGYFSALEDVLNLLEEETEE